MMAIYDKFNRLLSRVVNNWPLKYKLGFYAYLPVFFVMGAAIEFTMINLRVGQVDFYTVYIRNEQKRLLEQKEGLSQRLEEAKARIAKEVESRQLEDSAKQK